MIRRKVDARVASGAWSVAGGMREEGRRGSEAGGEKRGERVWGT